MCGGIMGALTFGLPQPIRQDYRRLLPFLLAYNGGRLITYSIAGLLFGAFGAGLFELLEPWLGQGWPQRLAAVVMILIGLYIAGLLPQLIGIERLGLPLWRRLGPIASRLMPVQRKSVALVYGLIWGWLPCGLVYAMLIAAAGQGSALFGGLLMLVFGLGTLPAVMLTGVLAGRIQDWAKRARLRLLAGLSLVLFGLVVLIYPTVIDWKQAAPGLLE
ncbi:MAG: sulfite exporter TauE/SafE family protein [Gammaproteobacteria bacterium]|nr:sulfite exporter TauE/SafE family protein [Gammaproteobacteria bacterium]